MSLGTGIVVVGMIGTLFVVSSVTTDLNAVDLTGVMIVSGFGMGFFLPPVTNLILAGIHARAAGAASGVLATVQQVGGALGVAVMGVVFYGVLSASAPAAAHQAVPHLESQLVAAGVPSAAARSIDIGFQACFVDRGPVQRPHVGPTELRRAHNKRLPNSPRRPPCAKRSSRR